MSSLDSESYNMIGNALDFSGTFNGTGCTIRNFTFISEGSSYIGIFGCIANSGVVKNLRLKNINIDCGEYDVRCIIGGLLLQKRDLVGWEPDALTYPTKNRPTPEQMEDLRIAWLAAKHTKSNTIVLVKGRKMVGSGAGQMNRV